MRGLCGVMSLNMVRVLMVGLLRVDNLVVLGVGSSMSIIVVHLEDKTAILNINLARHKEG